MKQRPDKTTLADDEYATKVASEVTGQEQTKQSPKGRKPDAEKSKRVRFNTMIDAHTKRRVKVYAAENDISLADVIDQALKMYLEAK